MRIRDTSAHPKTVNDEVTGSLKQGDDTSSNPGHGKAMDNVRRSGTPSTNEKPYYPPGLDPQREDPIPEIEEMPKGEH